MLSDASLYSGHRSMQEYDTELFLSSIVKKMDWSRQEEDIVMDIGCGPGNNSCKVLLPFLPRVNKLIGVDVLPDMIEYARKNNSSEKVEYHVANIEDESTIERWYKTISKAISIYCFNWVGNQKEAFKNVYNMLKPGGEAALLFVLSTPFYDSYKIHMKNPKWKQYLENSNPYVPESHIKKYDALYYQHLLENVGFSVKICEDENRTFVYANDDDCRDAAFVSGLTSYIPNELKDEFKEDLFRGFVEYNGRSSDGRPMLRYKVLSTLVQKRKE